MRVVMMGPPGAGKGTQAVRLASSAGVAFISTGELFRAHIRDRTPLGVQIAAIVDGGGYVPDQLTNALVRDRLGRPDAAGGFVLDGYPRTLDQVDELDRLLAGSDAVLDAVLALDVSDEEAIARATMRRTAEDRSDDAEDVVRTRLTIYHRQTAPLLQEYVRRGMLVAVDGTYPPDEVAAHIETAIRAVARVPR